MKRIKYSEEYIQKRVKWYYECWDFIKKAEYKNATKHAKLGLTRFPDDTNSSHSHALKVPWIVWNMVEMGT